jgi:branched-chain amino acid transport system substrate-binding protein
MRRAAAVTHPWRASITAIVAALALIAVTGCGGDDDDGGSEPSGDPIVVGSILDRTGPINIYGKAMHDATRFAIEDINRNGGVLGRRLDLASYDAQSANERYTQFARQLALDDQAEVIMGGITSASREAIRPIVDQQRVLYFYNEQYEGGVCDKNVFNTGVIPSQQLQALIPWTIDNVGPRLYVVAADYNYGQISAEWVEQYAEENGGEVVGTEFIPLESSNFGSVIGNIQQARPDAVVSLLVGGNHIAFYRDFAARGLRDRIRIVSPTFGLGNEQVVVTPDEAEGIVVAYPYFQELDNPTNREFVTRWHAAYGEDYDYITDSAVTVWNGWHLWAAAVEEAGTTDRDAVIEALETGVEFDSPSGRVELDGPSHHVAQNISIAEVNDERGFDIIETRESVPPSYEQEVCDLVEDPTTNEQFTP